MGIHWIILDPLIIGRGVDIDFDLRCLSGVTFEETAVDITLSGKIH